MRVALHLTQDCNLRCHYCYTGRKSDLRMTPATADRAVDFLFEQPIRDYLAITFFGGEPLLAVDMIERVVARVEAKRAERPSLKVRFAVNTNGTILDQRIAHLLERHAFHIFVSIDGGPAAHDRHRVFPDQQGSFFAVTQNLETFRKVNPYVVTLSTVTPETAASVADTAEHLIDRGLRVVMLTPDYTAAWDAESLGLLAQGYEKLAELYLKCHRRGRKLFLNLFDDRINSHVHRDKPRDACNLADSEFSIAPDGTLFPCVQFVTLDAIESKRLAIGDVNAGWDDEARQDVIAQSSRVPSLCTACALNGRCMNYCGCVNYRTTGRLDDVSPFLCSHERMLFPIVDRVGEVLFKERNELFLKKFYDPHFSLVSVLEDMTA